MAEIAKRGAATSYAVAQAFIRSPSEFWSGSAGAVYPMIKRLAARGLLTAMPGVAGRRPRLEYQLTAEGLESLHDWLLDSSRATGLGFDPLRTRLVHLDLVPKAKRTQFLEEVRSKSRMLSAHESFEDRALSRKVYATWLKARAHWLAMLDQLIE